MRIVAEALTEHAETPQWEGQVLHALVLVIGKLQSSGDTMVPDHPTLKRIKDFLSNLVSDVHMKRMCALEFVRMLRKPDDGLWQWASHLSVQFLTVSSVVKWLQVERNEIDQPGIFQALVGALLHTASLQDIKSYEGVRRVEFGVPTSKRLVAKNLDSQVHLIFEISYCLMGPEFARQIVSVRDVLRPLLLLMMLLQQAKSSHRRDSDDDSWDMITYELKMATLFPRISEAVKSGMTFEEHKTVLGNIADFIHVFISHTLMPRSVDPLLSWTHDNSPYKNPDHGIFFELPLHRLFSAYCASVMQAFPDEPLRNILPEPMHRKMHNYTESVLTLLFTRSQVASSMWRRDHMGVEKLMFHYSHPTLMVYFSNDIYFMQLYAAMSPTSAVAHIAHRHSTHQPLVPTAEDETNGREHNVLEHVLRILLQIATDRTKMNDSSHMLRARVMHELSVGPKKNSALQGLSLNLGAPDDDDDEEDVSLQGIIEECADAVSTSGVTEFVLKRDLWPQVNPYFIEWVRGKDEADSGFVKVFPKSRKLIPCSVPPTPRKALRPVIGTLINEVAVSIAMATIKQAGNKLVTEGGLRAALDILILGASLHQEYKECWDAVSSAEDQFYACRREMDGVKAVIPDVVVWPEYDGDSPPSVAEVLVTPTSNNEIPLVHVAALLRLQSTKDLHPAARDLLDLVARHSNEAAEAVKSLDLSSTEEGGTNTGARKKAKGKARQKAAISKMQNQQKALDFDIPDSDEEGDAAPTDGADEHKSAHYALDHKWMEGDNCSLCNMATSPNGSSDVGMICLATKTRGMSGCFSRVGDDSKEKPSKKGRYAHSNFESNVFANAVQHAQDIEVLHTCGHFVHLDCLESSVKEMKTLFNYYRNHRVVLTNPEEIRRGFDCLNIDKNEYLCPLCGRIANYTIPMIVPQSESDKTKARQLPLSKVMTEVADQEDLDRDDDEVLAELLEVMDDHDEVFEGKPLNVDNMSFLHFLESTSSGVSEVLFGPQRFMAGGSAAVVFAQQAAVTEIQTRSADDADKHIPFKKLVALRTVLKAIVAAERCKDGDPSSLAAFLGMEQDDDDSEGSTHALLTSDVYGLWVQTVLEVVLRVDTLNHSVYRYLTLRTVEALLVKLVLELLTSGFSVDVDGLEDVVELVTSHLPRNLRNAAREAPDFDVAAYIAREMAVVMSWMAVAHCVITAPLHAHNLYLPSFADPHEALKTAAGLLGLGDSHASLAAIAAVINERDDGPATASAWLEAAHKTPPKPLLRSDGLPSLIQLPEEYATLVNRYLRTPGKCGKIPEDPVLCLSCGDVVCSRSKSKCSCYDPSDPSKGGACQQHAMRCGGGQSLFLSIKTTTLLAIDGPRYCDKVPSPYVDSFGEDDPGLQRGRPLYFKADRYKRVQQLAAFGMYGFDSALVQQSRILDRAQF
eukprot:TRINITY_DN5953_c0_g1_i3.p1 TRINITY_DN5953_c0_g1~~TRINITY_DN5953_c0_g1_i3.p1  ORF type:complete len:1633 (+),score=526.58 TRINITY_DN5953_c0_g1_i3:646-4899(+)